MAAVFFSTARSSRPAFRHGSSPAFTGDEKTSTRQPLIPKQELIEIQQGIDKAERIVLQHGKFDYQALRTVMPKLRWPWPKIDDSLISGHLIASSQPHDLTSMVLIYLGLNIKPFEEDLKTAVVEAKKIIRKEFPEWAIAKAGRTDMPSAKGSDSKSKAKGKQDTSAWSYDMWTPRAVAQALEYPDDHPWRHVARLYNCADTTTTVLLKKAHEKIMVDRGLMKIYVARLKYLPVIAEMEEAGVTIHEGRLRELEEEYKEFSEGAEAVCKGIAKEYNYDLELPAASINNSLRHFIWGCTEAKCPKCGYQIRFNTPAEQTELNCPQCNKVKAGRLLIPMQSKVNPYLGLPAVKLTGNKEPSLDKEAMELYQLNLPEGSKPLMFINKLRGKRSRDTALTYMKSYERFWVPVQGEERWFRLFPSLNPTGTATLRCSSERPNEQNISRREDFNLRYMFGPVPGREWYSLDYENLELRIPAYVSNERVMIELFEKPNEPPYFGSYHLMNASIIYPDLFYGKVCPHCWDMPQAKPCKHAPKVRICDLKGAFKKKYEASWYRYVKGFGFAFSYGCLEPTGDRAAHKKGAYALVKDNLKEHSKLNAEKIDMANRLGYVETLPDSEIDPTRGYPVECKRSKWGRISPTVPLNFFVQSSACWIMMRAMVKIAAYLKTLPDYYMVMQIHDEVVLDFPCVADGSNSHIVKKVASIMASVGECVGVPLTVGTTHHPHNWSDGE